MDDTIATKLRELNLEFYQAFAAEFDESRSVSDPALTAILPYVEVAARVLDVGCGNGRLAALLDIERPRSSYVGMDASPRMVDIARRRAGRLRHVAAEFFVGDAMCASWTNQIEGQAFDLVVALAVLHHIPTPAARLGFMRDLARLAGGDGRVIVSSWQFLDSPRLRKKVVPWAEVSISPESVDDGDYLLDWRRGGHGLRYCHLVDSEEMRSLASAAGLSIIAEFRAGGRENNLSLTTIFGPSNGAQGTGARIVPT